MGHAQPLPSSKSATDKTIKVAPVPVHPIEAARCELCGKKLGARSLHHRVMSPLTSEVLTVCRTCQKAAVGEGYRPAE